MKSLPPVLTVGSAHAKPTRPECLGRCCGRRRRSGADSQTDRSQGDCDTSRPALHGKIHLFELTRCCRRREHHHSYGAIDPGTIHIHSHAYRTNQTNSAKKFPPQWFVLDRPREALHHKLHYGSDRHNPNQFPDSWLSPVFSQENQKRGQQTARMQL